MAALDIELVLSPEELLAVMDRGARDAHVAADTGAHERDLAAPAVLLGEVRALHCRVAGGGRELLQLELVDAIGSGEGKKDEKIKMVSEGPLYIGLPHQRCQKFARYGVPQHMDFTSAPEVLWGANAMEAFSTPRSPCRQSHSIH